MELYSNVLNQSKIYDTLFMKIFTVSEYSGAHEFKIADLDKYDIWAEKNEDDDTYLDNTALTPEYSKIVGVTFCTISNDENGEMKRNFHNIYNQNNEVEVIEGVFATLSAMESKVNSPLLCGHNLLGYDIPHLIKKGVKHGIAIPQILKTAINSKPWESCVLDTMTLWKFNGYDYTSLNEIAVFLGLKYNTLPMDEFLINYKYWTESNQVQDWYQKETMNRVNLTLQLLKKLRSM